MILIKDGRVIDPKRGIDDVLDLLIEDGKIKKIGKYQRSDDYERIVEAKGLIVAPGLIDTPLLEAVHAATLQEIVARIPLARMGRAEEVARVVRFLADEGTYITGAVIPVNGGLHLG